MSLSLEVTANWPVVKVVLEGPVTVVSATTVAHEVGKQVDAMEGEPFGLLFDLRKVTRFDDEAGPLMQKIELDAAPKGLEKVAHLVAQPEVVQQLDAELKALGGEKLIGNFNDAARALSFAAGLNP